MSSIAAALERDTITWKPGKQDRLELLHDDDVLAHISDDEIVIEGRRMLLQRIRGQLTLMDTARGASVAGLRMVGQHTGRVGAVTLARHRIRVSRASVLPFKWHVTDDLGGPELLTARHFRGRIRVRRGADFDSAMDAGVAVVAIALTVLPELTADVDAPAAA